MKTAQDTPPQAAGFFTSVPVIFCSPSANDVEEAQPQCPMERLTYLGESPSSCLPA